MQGTKTKRTFLIVLNFNNILKNIAKESIEKLNKLAETFIQEKDY